MKTTIGVIDISYHIYCPHCNAYIENEGSKHWFESTMGSDFPIDDGYKQSFEAECPECKKDFIIKHWEH